MIHRVKVTTVPAGREKDLRADTARTWPVWQRNGVEWPCASVRVLGIVTGEALIPASVSQRVSLWAPRSGSICALRRVSYVKTEALSVGINVSLKSTAQYTYLGEGRDPSACISQWLLEIIDSQPCLITTSERRTSYGHWAKRSVRVLEG